MPHIVLCRRAASSTSATRDGILHNIHTYSEKNPPLNRAQPKFKKTIDREVQGARKRVKLACDVHGWMQGWMVVEDNPYYAVTDDKGAFKLTDVPPGDYEVKVWQEKLGERRRR